METGNDEWEISIDSGVVLEPHQEIAHLDNSMMKILVTNEVHIGKFAV